MLVQFVMFDRELPADEVLAKTMFKWGGDQVKVLLRMVVGPWHKFTEEMKNAKKHADVLRKTMLQWDGQKEGTLKTTFFGAQMSINNRTYPVWSYRPLAPASQWANTELECMQQARLKRTRSTIC